MTPDSHSSASDQPVESAVSRHQDTLKSDDAMVGVIVGGILTLAFVVLLVAMLVVNLWTFSSVAGN